MQRIPVALSLDALGDDARAAFDVASASGYEGIAFATNHPQLNPAELSDTARRHLKTTLFSRNLNLASIRVAAPRGGLGDAGSIDRTLENARRAIGLAHSLGVKTVSLFTGSLGADSVLASSMATAARDLAAEADKAGITLAISSDHAAKLRELLGLVSADHLRANLEPATLLSAGEDPLSAVERLGGAIAQFTAADAIRAGRQVRAVELGEGQVPWADMIAQLREQGFRGPTVVDLRDLPNGPEGARHAAEVLRRLYLAAG